MIKYSEKAISHYQSPHNVGTLDEQGTRVGTGVVGAPECGDVVKLQIQINDNGRIIEAKFKTFGCVGAIACSSLATDRLMDRTIEQAMLISHTELASELELPPEKMHCSVLAENAIRTAIENLQHKNDAARTADSPSRKRGR
jgi:nitrogen fixation NifU-like protein